MTILTPTTELEAVNLLLFTIGEAPISSLSVGQFGDSQLAISALNEVNRACQTEGWTFNVDTEYKMRRSAAAPYYITMPDNMVEADPDGSDASLDIVQRGQKLYDRKNHTFLFPDKEFVYCTVTWLLPYEDLPEIARYYIAVRAARLFQDRVVGSQVLHAFSEADERRAWRKLRKYEARSADRNILYSSPSARRVIMRGHSTRGPY